MTTRKDLRIRLGGFGFVGDFVGDSVNEVHTLFPPLDKNDAINEAITQSQERWMRHVEDESVTVSTDTYRYALGGLSTSVDRTLGLDDIWQHTSGDSDWYRVDPNAWHIADAAGSLYLEFDVKGLPANSQILRLQYRAYPPTLSADTSTLAPDETAFADFICAKAAALLFRNRMINITAAEVNALPVWKALADEMDVKAERLYGLRFHVAPKKRATRSGW